MGVGVVVGVGLPANLSDKACAAAEALAKAGEWNLSFAFLLVKAEVKGVRLAKGWTF